MVLYKLKQQQKRPFLTTMAATYSCFCCLVLLLWHWPSPTLACSSRSVPKPRPSSIRSNVIPTTAGTFISSNSNGRILNNGEGGGAGGSGGSLLSSSKSATVGTKSLMNTAVNAKTTFKTAAPRSANNKKTILPQQQQQQQQQSHQHQHQDEDLPEGGDGHVPGTNKVNYKITLTTTTTTSALSSIRGTSTTTTTATTSTSTSTTTTTSIMNTSARGSEQSADLMGITTTSTIRPNITFPTFKCPANYDAWYCLNEATCFTVKIGDSIMYNCECAIGFMGPRCEYKELDGSYQPKRPKPILEKASVANGATCFLLFFLFLCLLLYVRCDPGRAVYLMLPRPHHHHPQPPQQQVLDLGHHHGAGEVGEDAAVQGKIIRMGKERVAVDVFKGVCEGEGRRGHRKYLKNGQQRKEDDEIDFTRDCCPYCCTQLQQKQTRRIL